MVDVARFKDLIRHRQQEIAGLDARSSLGSATVELDQAKVGRLSRIDALQMQQMSLATQRRRKGELVALDSALKRIEQDKYGICVECGENIPPKRLEIDLVAIYCVGCASNLEHQ